MASPSRVKKKKKTKKTHRFPLRKSAHQTPKKLMFFVCAVLKKAVGQRRSESAWTGLCCFWDGPVWGGLRERRNARSGSARFQRPRRTSSIRRVNHGPGFGARRALQTRGRRGRAAGLPPAPGRVRNEARGRAVRWNAGPSDKRAFDAPDPPRAAGQRGNLLLTARRPSLAFISRGESAGRGSVLFGGG